MKQFRLGKTELTANQFEYINFKDSYGNKCSVQQSSLADFNPPGSSALWIGVNEVSPELGKGPHAHGTLTPVRMHVKLEQVKALIEVLQYWVVNCTIDPEYRTDTREQI